MSVVATAGGRAGLAQPDQYQIDAEVAQAYADAYAARDLVAVGEFLAEDAVFDDVQQRVEGREAILEHLSGVFERVTRQGAEGREIGKFRSGNDFVFMAWADFYMMLAIAGRPAKEFNFKLDFVMTLTVVNGEIVHQADYVDTEAFGAQLQAQVRAIENEEE